jgi:hypothetical protein
MKIADFRQAVASISRLHLILISSGILVVIAGILLLTLTNRTAIEFKTYTSNQGGFSVDVPTGEMVLTRDRTTFMEKSVMQFTHQAKVPEGVFRIIHFDLPPGVITPAERTTIVNQLVTGFIAPIQGLLVTSSEATIQGYEAVQVTATGSTDEKEYMADAAVILVSNRVYVVGYHGEKGRKSRKLARRFVSSFRFNF